MKQLGAFFWYSLPNEMLPVTTVRRIWRRNGLDLSLLPKSRKPADVAAEACSIVDRSPTGPSFTQVEKTSERLLYRASFVVAREDPQVGGEVEVVFDKATAEFACLDEELLRHVRSVYEQNSDQLPAHKQRQALRAWLLNVGAENWHGSIYFMPAVGEALEQLNKAWRTVYELHGEKIEFHMVPVDATDLQVSYVGAAFDAHLTEETGRLIAEVREMREREPHRKWRSDRIDAIVARKKALEARGDRFAVLLGVEPQQAFAAAKEMDEVVAELVERTGVRLTSFTHTLDRKAER